MSGEKPAPTAADESRLAKYRAFMATGPRFGIVPRYEAQLKDASPAWLAGWYHGMLDEALAALDAAEDKLARACALADRTAASHVETRTRAETAERERDELRTKLDGAIVVSDSPETVERVARALAVSDGYTSDASRELVSTFLADARAVLAALREARP